MSEQNNDNNKGCNKCCSVTLVAIYVILVVIAMILKMTLVPAEIIFIVMISLYGVYKKDTYLYIAIAFAIIVVYGLLFGIITLCRKKDTWDNAFFYPYNVYFRC